MSGPFSFEVIESLSKIEAIQTQWDQLLLQSTCYRPFLSASWFIQACKIFDHPPKVFLAKNSNEDVVGILPLALAAENSEGQKSYCFPEIHLADATDILVSKGQEKISAELLRFAIEDSPTSCVLFFRDIEKKSNLLRGAIQLGKSDFDFDYEIDVRLPVPWVDSSGGWEAYRDAKSTNFRKDVKRTFAKLERAGFTFSGTTTQQISPQDIVEQYLTLHLNSFSGSSHFQEPEVQNFCRTVFPSLIENGHLLVWTCKKEGKIVGIYLDAAGPEKRRMAYQLGYDPTFKDMGIGKALCLYAVQQACSQKIDVYSLGRTTNLMKERIQTDVASGFTFKAMGKKETL